MVHYIRRGCRCYGRPHGQLNILSFVTSHSRLLSISLFSDCWDHSRTFRGSKRPQYHAHHRQSVGSVVYAEHVCLSALVVVVQRGTRPANDLSGILCYFRFVGCPIGCVDLY